MAPGLVLSAEGHAIAALTRRSTAAAISAAASEVLWSLESSRRCSSSCKKSNFLNAVRTATGPPYFLDQQRYRTQTSCWQFVGVSSPRYEGQPAGNMKRSSTAHTAGAAYRRPARAAGGAKGAGGASQAAARVDLAAGGRRPAGCLAEHISGATFLRGAAVQGRTRRELAAAVGGKGATRYAAVEMTEPGDKGITAARRGGGCEAFPGFPGALHRAVAATRSATRSCSTPFAARAFAVTASQLSVYPYSMKTMYRALATAASRSLLFYQALARSIAGACALPGATARQITASSSSSGKESLADPKALYAAGAATCFAVAASMRVGATAAAFAPRPFVLFPSAEHSRGAGSGAGVRTLIAPFVSVSAVKRSSDAIASSNKTMSERSSAAGSGSADGGSRKSIMSLPLGTLYSKTHEYVRLLLEFVGAGSSTAESSAVAEAAREGRANVVDSRFRGRPKYCRLVGFVGISAHAAEELGEVVYCEFTRPLVAAAAAEVEAAPAEEHLPQQQASAGGNQPAAEVKGSAVNAGAGADQESMWVRRGSTVCSLESVKSVAETYSPVEGVVLAINNAAAQDPALVWRDSEGSGWLVKLLIPLPVAAAARSGSDDEKNEEDLVSAVYFTDADVAVAPAAVDSAGGAHALDAKPAAELGEVSAAGASRAKTQDGAGAAAAWPWGDDYEKEAYAFLHACRNCVRLGDALVGLRRRLMGPQQYMQFIERERKAAGTER